MSVLMQIAVFKKIKNKKKLQLDDGEEQFEHSSEVENVVRQTFVELLMGLWVCPGLRSRCSSHVGH